MKQPELGKIILDLRTQQGLTQEELVEKCNISVRTIQRIESGEVTPRPYTIKTILEVLGYDLGKIKSESLKNFKNHLTVRENQEILRSIKILRIAIVFGVLYFLLGFFEVPADWSRWFKNTMLYSNSIYVVLKVFACVSFIIFTYGYLTLGKLFNNNLIKFASIGFIFLSVILYSFDIISLYTELINDNYIIVMSILFGSAGIVFGVGIIQLNKSLGNLATITGALEIVMSLMFTTVVLAWLGYIFMIIVIIMELILLYTVLEKLKNND